LKDKGFFISILCLMLVFMGNSLFADEEKPKAKSAADLSISQLTKAMTDRLTTHLHVKNIVGDPVKVGKVTIIPIIMIDVGFGGGGGGPGGEKQMGGYGYGISGEAKPLGFVVVSKAGVKFVSVGKIPRK
jgi:uncharacterized spore protein YtfJ